MFEIEKNIPITGARKRLTGIVETMRKMEIGDSFLANGRSGSWHPNAKEAGIKIITRRQPCGKYRIWRIA